MSKHTPGPWVAEADRSGYWDVMPKSGGWAVVGCEGIDCEANARLIAAAPELLEALVKVVRWMESPSEGAFSDADLEKAKNAIAKAEGKA